MSSRVVKLVVEGVKEQIRAQAYEVWGQERRASLEHYSTRQSLGACELPDGSSTFSRRSIWQLCSFSDAKHAHCGNGPHRSPDVGMTNAQRIAQERAACGSDQSNFHGN